MFYNLINPKGQTGKGIRRMRKDNLKNKKWQQADLGRRNKVSGKARNQERGRKSQIKWIRQLIPP